MPKECTDPRYPACLNVPHSTQKGSNLTYDTQEQERQGDPYSRIPHYACQATNLFLEVPHEYPQPTGVPQQPESQICLFFTRPRGSEGGQSPLPPLKRSRSASSKSKTSRPRPPPGGSSWSVDSVGEPRLLVPAASPLRSRSRLSPVTNAESTAGEGRGRIRPPAQTPGRHKPMPALACQGARAPPSGSRRGSCSDLSPYPQQSVPIPPDLRGRRQPSYLQPERASAPPTAAASWSRTRRRRRGSNHFGGGGHGALAPEPRRAERRRCRRARSAAGLRVQAWLDLRGARDRWVSVCSLGPSVRASVRPSPCTSVRVASRVPRAAPSVY